MPAISPRRPRAVPILGCGIDPLRQDEVLHWCFETCRGDHRARILLTANASHLVAMQDDDGLREAARAADLVTPDGMSLVWAGRLLGGEIPERVAGIDLLEALLRGAPAKGLRVFLLGAKPAVMQRFVAHCRSSYPGIEIAGWRDGYFSVRQEPEVARAIRAARPDMLFVAMSSPRKEYFLGRWGSELGVPFSMGVGGAIDVLAGVTRRAPHVLQRLGLEWAYRVAQEPRRLARRYAVTNSLFIVMTLRSAGQRRRDRPPLLRAGSRWHG